MVPINQNNSRTFNFNYWYDYYFLSNIVYLHGTNRWCYRNNKTRIK